MLNGPRTEPPPCPPSRESRSVAAERHRTKPRSCGKLLSIAIAMSAFVLSACLPPQLAVPVARTALSDPRLEGILKAHHFKVTEARYGSSQAGVAAPAVFTIVFVEPVPFSEWPLDYCDTLGSATDLTGISWLVDMRTNQVAAVTPISHETACARY